MRPGWRGLPALLLWVVAGCEALVDGKLGDVRCTVEGAVGPPACLDGQECVGGLCVATELGALCATDADCAVGDFCLDPGVLGGAGDPRCSRPCCSSSDCPDPESVCWIPPIGGGSFCRPATEVGRAPGGTLAPLATCAADGDCRSGRCIDHQCVDTCCSDTICAPGGVCKLGDPLGVDEVGFWCGAPLGTAGRYAMCEADATCASGLCLDFGNGLTMCSAPCCSSTDCETADGVPVRCVILGAPHQGVRACGAVEGAGAAAVGVACTEPSDCRGGMCLALGGRSQCSDLCCSDASCGESPSVVCRPAIVDSGWALRCEPK
jgi:hypothetical protein